MKMKASRVSLLCIVMISFLNVSLFAAESLQKDTAVKQELKNVLGEYINTAIENNLDISISRSKVESAGARKNEALANFFPKLTFQSRYSVSGGGRIIEIDLNKFVGPIFPGIQLPKTEFAFLRPHEHDTKFNLTQNIFTGGAVLNGYNARSSLHDAAKYELRATIWNKRQEVTEAYLNYLKAVELVDIRKNVLALAKEGHALTTSLFRQDKLLRNDVMRARVNVSRAESDLASSQQQKRLASRYFNNLLNRNPFTPIEEVSIDIAEAREMDSFGDTADKNIEADLSKYEKAALNNRSELASLKFSLDAVGKLKNVAFSGYLPKVILSIDYGWQGEEYSFTPEDDYYMASLIFQINLFDGGAREAKMEQAVQRVKELELQEMAARRNIGLQVEQSFLTLQTARKQLDTSARQLESAKENYRIVEKRFRLGMALSLDMNDALAQYDIASSQNIITLYDYLRAIYKMKNVLGSSVEENLQ